MGSEKEGGEGAEGSYGLLSLLLVGRGQPWRHCPGVTPIPMKPLCSQVAPQGLAS